MLITITEKLNADLERIEIETITEQKLVPIPDAIKDEPSNTLDTGVKTSDAIEGILGVEHLFPDVTIDENPISSENAPIETIVRENEIENYEVKQLFLNDFNEWSDIEKVEISVEALISEVERLTLSEVDAAGIIPIKPFLPRPLLDTFGIELEEDDFVSKLNKKEMLREIARTIFETYKNKNYFVRLS